MPPLLISRQFKPFRPLELVHLAVTLSILQAAAQAIAVQAAAAQAATAQAAVVVRAVVVRAIVVRAAVLGLILPALISSVQASLLAPD